MVKSALIILTRKFDPVILSQESTEGRIKILLIILINVTFFLPRRLFNNIINHQLIKNKQVMRKISVVLIAIMLLSSVSSFANRNPKKAQMAKDLSTQIAELLTDNNFVITKNDLTANVSFTMNKNGEMVVLMVETDNPVLEGFVKSRLNYKKVDLTNFREGQTYTVPIRITEA
jgi:hypothetical protein